MSTRLPDLKRTLRKSIQQTLRTLPEVSVSAQSATLLRQITSHPSYQRSRSLSIYLSMPAAEVQTLPIISHALGEGKAVFVPLLAKGEPLMEMVRIYEGEVEAGLPSDSWGIPVVERCRKDGKERENAMTLRDGTPPLDLIICPGVAFSPTLGSSLASRLGHGKGYYDRFITLYRSLCAEKCVGGPTVVGLALREQWLAEAGAVPVGDHDVLLDEVWKAVK